MSDDRPPRLSGWCTSAPGMKADQFHTDCRSSTCECPGDPATHGRDALFSRGLGVSAVYANDSRTAPRRCAKHRRSQGPNPFRQHRKGLTVIMPDENPEPPSPIETLRLAAALMRERAEAVECPEGDALTESWADAAAANVAGVDGAFIASWHPGAALTVTDWLDDMARLQEEGDSGGPLIRHHALTVARAYLGGDDRG